MPDVFGIDRSVPRFPLPWWAKVPAPQRVELRFEADRLADRLLVHATWHNGMLGSGIRVRHGEAVVTSYQLMALDRRESTDVIGAACTQALIAAGITPWMRKSGFRNGRWSAWIEPKRSAAA